MPERGPLGRTRRAEIPDDEPDEPPRQRKRAKKAKDPAKDGKPNQFMCYRRVAFAEIRARRGLENGGICKQANLFLHIHPWLEVIESNVVYVIS